MLLEREEIKVFVYKEPIDMRAGFEKLHAYCVHHMQAKMNEGNAFVFFGRNRDAPANTAAKPTLARSSNEIGVTADRALLTFPLTFQ